jgi:type IV pilus assembly protein PilV
MLQPTDIKRRKQGLLSNGSGFSFIDLMLALVILTIGVLALADLQIISSKANTSSRGLTTASSLAETKLEAIKNTTYASIAAEAATTVTGGDGKTYTRTVTVTPNSPLTNTKTVTVTVTWQDSQNKTHTMPMATVIAQ